MENEMTETIEQLEARLQALKSQQILKWVDVDEKHRPLKTVDNLQQLLNFYGVVIRYNQMSKEIEIDIPGFKDRGDLKSNAVMGELENRCNLNHWPVGREILNQYITLIAYNNEYHPVRDWIDSQVWDGRSRLQDLYDSVVLREPNPMKETILRKWALSAVAALYHPRFSCEGVLTFSGAQGIGKTTWVQQLLPAEGVDIWSKSGVVLSMSDKDTQLKALGVWLCELGELDATFKKSDIEALKGFITESVDTIRPAYAPKANKYSRSTIFYATVNERQFLQDSENRRFWVLEVERFINGAIDAAQLWAEIKQIYLSLAGKTDTAANREKYNEWGWFMSPAERAQMSPLQESHRVINPTWEMLERVLEPHNIVQANSWPWRSATEILQRAGVMVPSKAQANDTAKWLRKNSYYEDSRCRFRCEFVENPEDQAQDGSVLQKKVVSFKRKYD